MIKINTDITNNNAKGWIDNYLLSGEYDNPVGMTLHNIYSYNAAGTNLRSANSNLEALVRYTFEESDAKCSLKNTSEIEYIKSCMESVRDRFDWSSDNCDNTIAKEELEQKYDKAQNILERISNNANDVTHKEIYGLLLEDWQLFYDWTYTYRLLAELTRLDRSLSNNQEKENIEKLIGIIEKVTNVWN